MIISREEQQFGIRSIHHRRIRAISRWVSPDWKTSFNKWDGGQCCLCTVKHLLDSESVIIRSDYFVYHGSVRKATNLEKQQSLSKSQIRISLILYKH